MSVHFTIQDIDRLAHLARLALTDDEKTLFARQLSDVLAHAEQLRHVDTTGVPPTSHSIAKASSLREDEARPSLARDVVLEQAPEADVAAGLFKVPRVLGS